MRFELVQERVAALPRELPAAPAILTPIRLDALDALDTGAPTPNPDTFRRGRPAAVLVLLFPDDEGQGRVLLTTRVAHISTHAGEVSFPGGSADPDDADPIATALREAAEEVALDPEACGLKVTGVLEVFPLTVSGFRITPVVAVAERRPECRPAPDEVARIVEAPVEAFLPDAPVELEERTIRQRLIRYGVYPVEGERVWGATARMLGQLGALLATEPNQPAPTTGTAGLDAEPTVRCASEADQPAIHDFLDRLAPELAHALPPASQQFIAEIADELVGLASWAPWDRDRGTDDPRGFDGLTLETEDRPAELTLLAVAPRLRGHGVGRKLTAAHADDALAAGSSHLLAWTLSDAAIHPSSIAARAFFRSNGFVDLAVDRRYPARGEDRLLLSRALR
jgi:8-oxo-dGTP pyrophosphatase MutT (NUDIX family)/GNAT superfamily N-acetyltransferase